ncbi:hypothetical protein A8L33_03450 [Microbacterium aurantiacum]|nr:hypothetical protein A8L33_03450 [Microbacterium chocolatum]
MVFRIPNAATHSLLDLLNLARCKCFGAHECGSLTRLSWGQRERYAVENQEPAGITGQVYTVVLVDEHYNSEMLPALQAQHHFVKVGDVTGQVCEGRPSLCASVGRNQHDNIQCLRLRSSCAITVSVRELAHHLPDSILAQRRVQREWSEDDSVAEISRPFWCDRPRNVARVGCKLGDKNAVVSKCRR